MLNKKYAQRRMALHVCAAMAAAVLSACGGGGSAGDDKGGTDVTGNNNGGNGSAAAITSTNYVSVAQQAVASSTFMVNGASLITGAQVSDPLQALAGMGLQQALQLGHWFKNAPAAVVGGVTVSDTESCSGGGHISATLNDGNGNDDIDTGDSATLQFASCVESGVTINGGLQLNATAVNGSFGSSSFSATVGVTYDNLIVAVGSTASVTGSGQMTIGIAATSANISSVTIDASSFSETGTIGGTSVSMSLSGYHLSVLTQPSLGGGSAVATTVNGTFVSSTLSNQQIQITTRSPLTTPVGQAYPSSGEILVKGAQGSQVLVTVQSGGMVQIQLDADGDGTFEASTTQSWASLN